MKAHLHLMHMRWLVYKQAIGKALREAHVEMVDYAREFRAMLESKP